jgi:hypothetical protein
MQGYLLLIPFLAFTKNIILVWILARLNAHFLNNTGECSITRPETKMVNTLFIKLNLNCLHEYRIQ